MGCLCIKGPDYWVGRYGMSKKLTPNEEDLATQVGIASASVDHVWCCISDAKVQQPVGRGRHAQTFSTSLQREGFSCHNPCTWTLEDR